MDADSVRANFRPDKVAVAVADGVYVDLDRHLFESCRNPAPHGRSQGPPVMWRQSRLSRRSRMLRCCLERMPQSRVVTLRQCRAGKQRKLPLGDPSYCYCVNLAFEVARAPHLMGRLQAIIVHSSVQVTCARHCEGPKRPLRLAPDCDLGRRSWLILSKGQAGGVGARRTPRRDRRYARPLQSGLRADRQ